MRQRTLILRLWRDTAGRLTVLLNDPLRGEQTRLAAADDLWEALETWSQSNLDPPRHPQKEEGCHATED